MKFPNSKVQDPDETPASSANALEKGDFPSPGAETSGAGGTNHRSMPTPSKGEAGRGVTNSKGTIGGGRGSSGKYSGTMGTGEVSTKCKGVMGG